MGSCASPVPGLSGACSPLHDITRGLASPFLFAPFADSTDHSQGLPLEPCIPLSASPTLLPCAEHHKEKLAAARTRAILGKAVRILLLLGQVLEEHLRLGGRLWQLRATRHTFTATASRGWPQQLAAA